VRSRFGSRTDEYYGLRDDERRDPELLAWLRAENAYTDATLAQLASLRERLYQEIVDRIPQDDDSVPHRRGDDWFLTRERAGREHPLYLRRRGAPDAPDEVLLDVDERARGRASYEVLDFDVSPDGRYVAWTEDEVGTGECTLRVRDLTAQIDLPDRVERVEPDIEWLPDSRSLLYVAKHPDTLRGYRVKRHAPGSPAEAGLATSASY
jgi:oligopeptidase B